MSKSVVIAVFVVLFLFMILDIIIGFPTIVRGVFYGGSFIAGCAIYILNTPKSGPYTSKDSE